MSERGGRRKKKGRRKGRWAEGASVVDGGRSGLH